MCPILTVSIILSKTLLSLLLMPAIRLNQTSGLISHSLLKTATFKGSSPLPKYQGESSIGQKHVRRYVSPKKMFGCYLENYISNHSTRRCLYKIQNCEFIFPNLTYIFFYIFVFLLCIYIYTI